MHGAMTAPQGVTCPWCRRSYANYPGPQCSNCGGELPTPVGQALGRPPPQAPRNLPSQYKSNILLWKNPTALVGTIFLGVGVLTAIVLIGFIFIIVGYFLRKSGIEAGNNKLAALERGQAAQGQILGVTQNTSVSINGRHPWRVEYGFVANGVRVPGSVESFDDSARFHQPGEPIWVVYLAEDPSKNSVWPPLV